ncbi:MAG: 6-phospho-3-hexuloisomerase [Candidatus Bathyarchaeota archaeon]|nr:6-phospho-3-hexuloisomerase [Candidatus Bathyarchaeota archaeon]
MIAYDQAVDQIMRGVQEILSSVSKDQVEKMVKMMLEAKDHRILIIGVGRSGLIGKSFAMRLMHLGFNVYVMGETITPAIGKNDLIISISGSGTTKLVVIAAEIAKEVDAKIIAVSSHPDSSLGKIADHIVQIRGRTKLASEKDYFLRQISGIHAPLAPLGTMFEISAAIFLDSVIAEVISKLGKTEDELRKKHATIE